MCSLPHRESHRWFCRVLYSANKATAIQNRAFASERMSSNLVLTFSCALLQWILFTLCTTAAPRSPDWWQSTHYIKKSHYFPKSSTYTGTTKETKMQFLPFKDGNQMQIWNTRSGPGTNWCTPSFLHLITPNHSLGSKSVFVLQPWKIENTFKYPSHIYLLHNSLRLLCNELQQQHTQSKRVPVQ